MRAKPEPGQSVREEQIRAALDQHWLASSDFLRMGAGFGTPYL